jgi:predicted Zn-dependent protease
MHRGDSIRAEHYFSLAIEHGYDKGELLPELLAVCLSSSRLRSALNYAEPYLRKHPDDSSLRYLVATVYLGLNQSAIAKQELRTVLRHHPDFADAHFLLGMLEFSDAPTSAQQHLTRYLDLNSSGEKANEARERLAQARFDERYESEASHTQRLGAERLPVTSVIPVRRIEVQR